MYMRRAALLILGVAVIAAALSPEIITVTGQNFHVTAGAAFSNQVIASFVTTNPSATPADFTAIIAWGDATTSAGTITNNSGFFVSGSHTYASAGAYPVTITVASAATSGIGTASATVNPAVAPAPVLSTPLLAGLAMMLAVCGAWLARKKGLA
jgi:hypothetical protein